MADDGAAQADTRPGQSAASCASPTPSERSRATTRSNSLTLGIGPTRTLYRVRVGPIPSVNEFDRVLARLRSLGLADAQLAAD